MGEGRRVLAGHAVRCCKTGSFGFYAQVLPWHDMGRLAIVLSKKKNLSSGVSNIGKAQAGLLA